MSNRISVEKKRWLPWLFGLSLLMNCGFLGGFVYHRYSMLPPPERLEHAQNTLQLNAQQRAALAGIQGDIRSEARENFRLTRERHHELVLLLRNDSMDLPALERHLRATTEPQVAMQRDVILRMLTFRDTLTPEQKIVFNEKMERPGFLLRLAGFAGPMWRGQGCHRDKRPGHLEAMPPSGLPGPPPSNL